MLSKFIDQSWLQFLCELNATLRTIRPSDLEGSIGRTLKLLDEYDSDELGGLRIRLAKFHPSGTRRLGIMLDLQPRTATNSLNLTGTIGGSSYNLKATEAEHAHDTPGNGNTTPAKKRRGSTTPRSNGKPPLSPGGIGNGKPMRRRSIREQMLSEDALLGDDNSGVVSTFDAMTGITSHPSNFTETTIRQQHLGLAILVCLVTIPLPVMPTQLGLEPATGPTTRSASNSRRRSEEELEKELLYKGDPWIYDGEPIDAHDSNIRYVTHLSFLLYLAHRLTFYLPLCIERQHAE